MMDMYCIVLYCVVFEDCSVKWFKEYRYAQSVTGFRSYGIGDEPYGMIIYLCYAQQLWLTQSTTISLTLNPTQVPTSNPRMSCDYESVKIYKYDYKYIWKNINGMNKCTECVWLWYIK